MLSTRIPSSPRFRWLSFLLLLIFTAVADAQTFTERKSVPGDAFSLRFPEGWTITEKKEKLALSAVNGKGLALEARDIEFAGSLEDLIKGSLAAFKKTQAETRHLDTEPFKTKGGMEGTILSMETIKDGEKVRLMLFFFKGRPGHVILLTCGFPLAKDTKENRAFYEEVANTVRVAE